MRIKISADSTCDLSPELIETYNIGITPLYIEKGGQNCRDGIDITPQEIFDYVRSVSYTHLTLPTTSRV